MRCEIVTVVPLPPTTHGQTCDSSCPWACPDHTQAPIHAGRLDILQSIVAGWQVPINLMFHVQSKKNTSMPGSHITYIGGKKQAALLVNAVTGWGIFSNQHHQVPFDVNQVQTVLSWLTPLSNDLCNQGNRSCLAPFILSQYEYILLRLRM